MDESKFSDKSTRILVEIEFWYNYWYNYSDKNKNFSKF